jgi:hypothetical protein
MRNRYHFCVAAPFRQRVSREHKSYTQNEDKKGDKRIRGTGTHLPEWAGENTTLPVILPKYAERG